MHASAPDPVLSAFVGRIRPVRASPVYAAALVLVAFLVLLMPVVYLGLIVLVGWLTCWHAATNMPGTGAAVGNFWSFILLNAAYAAPIGIGVVLLVFMVKPLFARSAARGRRISLDPRRETRVFSFVGALCDAVGSPRPDRIEVDCEVNAAASFGGSNLGLPDRSLVLHIGLGLVAGLDVRQFAAVLAHEFGHFSQGWAMRVSFLIRSVQMWFARAVYERDALDARLEELSEDEDSGLATSLLMWLSRAALWITRRMLWLLLMVCDLFVSLLSRQMEFDADRHAARVVGREAFADMLRCLPVLGIAEQAAMNEVDVAGAGRRLPDDLPALVRASLERMPAGMRQGITAEGLSETVGMYASHPAPRDRIAAGAAEPEQGIFAADGPATQLFADFRGISRRTTLAWYAEHFGREVPTQHLVATDALLAEQRQALAT